MTGYGYRIDHIEIADRCCESHNINCEPPGDLCCRACPEVDHYHALTNEHPHPVCVLDPCVCRSEVEHLGATQPGHADRVGMREPTEREAWAMRALSRTVAALAPLEPDARRRVLVWADSRFNTGLVQSTREENTRG
jgi:hypothetical protein